MNEEWLVIQQAAYGHDATQALDAFLQGERDPDFFVRCLELLRTYTEFPRDTQPIPPPDQAMVELAKAIHHHVVNLGYFYQISQLWAHLIPIAEKLKQPELYVELVKQLSIVKEFQGNSHESFKLQTKLTQSAMFDALPPHQQVDLLHHLGTALVWQGKLVDATTVLQRGLTIANQHPGKVQQKSKVDQRGLRSTAEPIPMWENRVYLLSQLGNVAMFRGEFEVACQIYAASYEILVEQGEENNLACVYDQAKGRLLLHWGRVDEAISTLEHGLMIRHRRNDQTGIAINSIYLAAAYLEAGNLRSAELLLNEGLVLTRQLGNRRDLGLCHLYFGQLELLRGRQNALFGQWRLALEQLCGVFSPLVEKRVFLSYLPWLFRTGKADLFQSIWSHLLRTLRQQEMGAIELVKILQRFKFRSE